VTQLCLAVDVVVSALNSQKCFYNKLASIFIQNEAKTNKK